MRTKKQIIIEQLDRKSDLFIQANKISIPNNSWINLIRKSLNMTLEQLGKKLGKSKQGIKAMEESEKNENISIKSLKEVAKALDMQLVYGFVSNSGSFNNYIEKKAKELATEIVMRTHQTMNLENQGNSKEVIERAIKELTLEIKQEIRRGIWD